MSILQRMTYADFMEQPDDGYLHELVRGEILRMPPPKGKHGHIEAKVVEAVGRYLYDRARTLGWQEDQDGASRDVLVGSVACGEAGIRFSLPDDPDQVRGLDVCYLSPEQVARHEAAGGNEYVPEVPVLVAEVISPSESAAYINEKVLDYLAGCAQLVWLVFPKTRVVQVFRPHETMYMVAAGDSLDGGTVLPGFSVPVASLFS